MWWGCLTVASIVLTNAAANTGCTSLITPLSVAILANCLWGTTLTALDFTACHLINDEAMVPLVEHCFNVHWLSVSRTSITDRGECAFRRSSCSTAQALPSALTRGSAASRLWSCVSRVCAAYTMLQQIDLFNLTETAITDAALPMVLRFFPLLTKLYLSTCNGIGDSHHHSPLLRLTVLPHNRQR